MLGQVWTDNRGVKYSADKKRLINASEITGTYIVNPETEFIDSYAFQQNSKIERVILPKKLKKIGNHAFQVCPYLNRIEFQDGVSEIDECAFGGCVLTEVYLPNGLHRISDALFSSCTNLLYVQIPKNVTSIGAHAFSDCHSLQYMVIPDNVSTIGDLAFRWCKSLYYVVLPAKLTSVGENIFDNCKSLKYIGIPKGAKSKFTLLMPQHADLFVEFEQPQINDKMEIIKKETLSFFQGKTNVIHCVMDNGQESYLSQSRSFDDEANIKGACKLNTVENEKKHVLFLFNSDDKEVGRYYIGKKLQGLSPERIIEIKDSLSFFDSWNQESSNWVPCVGVLANNPLKDIASKAMSFTNSQNSKKDTEKINLSSVVSEEDLTNAYKDESGVMYSADGKRLLRITDELFSYSIKDGTKVICNGAFNWAADEDSYILTYNESLESVIIPDTVVRIGENAFRNCIALEEIVTSNNLIEIGNHAFSGCKSLLSFLIPNSVKRIGEAVFYGCESLKSINIPNSITELEPSVFSECAISQISIPNTITKIGDYAFYCCNKLKRIHIPDSVKQFGVGVFGGCSSLSEVNITHSIKELGFEFFSCCAFSEIEIPDTVNKIGDRAFWRSSISKITIPESVATIGEEAFCESSLNKITLPNSLTEIADNTFMSCSIEQLIIPNSIKRIGSGAFQWCSFLKEITIPDSVSEIGDIAFQFCDSLNQISFEGIVTKIGSDIFKGCDSLKQIMIPVGSKEHYEKLLYDYKDILNEQGSYRHGSNLDNSIGSQLFAHIGKTFNTKVNSTKHLLLLQNLLNNSLYTFKHPSDKSALPSFMWNGEGLSLGYDSILPYTIPFLWIRTIASRNVEKFDEVIDLLYKEFGVEVSEKIDVAKIVQGIKLYGFSDFKPNFDAHVNKSLLSIFYGDCICLENFILFFGSNIDMSDMLPSQSKEVYISAASFSLNKIICEMVNDFRQGNIDGN